MAVVSALAVPSIAVAEVKIIGQAQLEVVNTSGDVANEGLTLDDASQAGVVGRSNASSLGITGNHDLGNGMTGIYTINFNFHADDAAGGTISGRDQFIGLKGDFGTIMAGRLNTPYKTSTVKWDPFLATFMQARGNNGMTALHNGYASNVVAYANKFGEASFVGAIAFDEENNDTPADTDLDAEHAITASLNMPVADSIELAVAFLSGQLSHLEFPGAAADQKNGTAVKVGLKWTSGDMTVAGQYEVLDEDLGDESNLYLTASMNMGNGSSIAAGVGVRTDEGATDAKDGTYTALGYKKAFNKMVSGHIGLMMVDEGVMTANKDVTQFGGGLRVKF